MRDFHPAAPAVAANGASPEKSSSASPSATTPGSRLATGQPTTPGSANGVHSRNGHSGSSSGDKRSKSPNRSAAVSSSKTQPGLRQSFVSPEGVKIRLTLFANEMTSVTGKEYTAPNASSAASGADYNGAKTPQRKEKTQSKTHRHCNTDRNRFCSDHTKVTPSTTFKEIDLSHIQSAISAKPNTPTSHSHAAPATISLTSFQKVFDFVYESFDSHSL